MSHVQIKNTSLSANPNENGPEGIRQIENGCNRDDINNLSTRYSDKDTSFYSGNQNNFQSQASQPNNYIHSLVSNDMEVKQTHENEKISNAKTNVNFNSNRRRLPLSLKRSASTVSDIQFMRRGK